MPRDYKVYFEDILEAAGKIQKFTAGISTALFSDAQSLRGQCPNEAEAISATSHSEPHFASEATKRGRRTAKQDFTCRLVARKRVPGSGILRADGPQDDDKLRIASPAIEVAAGSQ